MPVTHEETFNAIIAAYLEAVEEGRSIDRRELLHSYPEMANELNRFFEDHDHLANITTPFRQLTQSPATFPLDTFGEYELIDEIARGGMGVVFKARHRGLNRLVALKMILAGPWSSTGDLQRFHTEVQAAAELDHPNIVPIYEVGCYNGQHFYTMKLIEGISLSRRIAGTPMPPRETARLMATVARAILHAHQRGILHRDLKPANILLDADGQPHVTDFGLAKRVPTQGTGDTPPTGDDATLDGLILGTPSYMAPEQATGQNRRLTTGVDVWGMGAILYEMLTGRPPFRGNDPIETLQKIQHEEPTRPRSLNPSVARDLETICLKCLQKEPSKRYPGALTFADDLERWLDGRPIKARPVGNGERLWRWCVRNPLVAGLALTMLLLLVAVAGASLVVAGEREQQLREEAGLSNLYAARGVASTLLWQLEHLSRPLLRAAENEELRRMLRVKDTEGLNRFCDSLYDDPKHRTLINGGDNPFRNWYILDTEGRMLGDSPRFTSVGEPFGFRDYHQGAMRHARSERVGRAAVHLSRVYLGKDDKLWKVALSIPVRDGPVPLGVLATTLTTTSTLGSLQLDDGKRTAVLAARADGSSTNEEYLIMLHPSYRTGTEAVALKNPRLQTVHRPSATDEFTLPEPRDAVLSIDLDYRDPADLRQGKWLAGFAPVGNTEYVVIVQQRIENALEADASLLRALLLWGALALSLGAFVTVVLRGFAQRLGR